MPEPLETVLTKQGKTFKDYRHLTITVGTTTSIFNIIKGRLYSDKKTMNPVYEPYPTLQEAADRLKEIALNRSFPGATATGNGRNNKGA
ncbi:hypothetical protein [Paenibacillus sp. DMB20]|uniref:hypothetical protein n=1 Tax=Paenibacillus sp. DMB20 TaxID=1642570 RepID=UPI0006274B5F|nr:hypothetical protein [Paenibacillus sp. DMB20]KKO54737.1 hypothetical protein XI25_05480 [Paenibacillus sp. DMB20]